MARRHGNLRSYAIRSMFVKKGEIFSADLHPILLSKERFL
jgi:hypothetical protein